MNVYGKLKMAVNKFSPPGCCCCVCDPTFCINLYDPVTLQSIPTDSGGPIDLSISFLTPYQWPSGQDYTQLSLKIQAGYSNPILFSSYTNDSLIKINACAQTVYPIHQNMSLGGSIGNNFGFHNTYCFGNSGTDVGEVFNIRPYPNSGNHSCFLNYSVCDIDVCADSHECINIPYCPTLINVTWPWQTWYDISINTLTPYVSIDSCSDRFSLLCINDGIVAPYGGGYSFNQYYYDVTSFYSSPIYNSGIKAPQARYDHAYFNLQNVFSFCNSGINGYACYSCNGGYSFNNPGYNYLCSPNCAIGDLYFCPCVSQSIDLCNTNNITQNCNYLGNKRWVSSWQCPGTTDCCGSSIYYPGSYPQGPLNITIKYSGYNTKDGTIYNWTFQGPLAPYSSNGTNICWLYQGCLPCIDPPSIQGQFSCNGVDFVTLDFTIASMYTYAGLPDVSGANPCFNGFLIQYQMDNCTYAGPGYCLCCSGTTLVGVSKYCQDPCIFGTIPANMPLHIFPNPSWYYPGEGFYPCIYGNYDLDLCNEVISFTSDDGTVSFYV